ncbi:Cep164 [Symbiodinium sp. CCMP2456]|nr:Cep164 [Symbiodinium sp. CCMP2456]
MGHPLCASFAGESVWDHPCDEHYRKVYEKYKAKKEADRTPGNDDSKRKDKKDKKEKKRKSGSGDSLGADLLDVPPKMDLPKPGESLFGKPSKNKLVFDCKPKAKAQATQPQAPASTADADSAFETQRAKLEADHQEKLQRLEKEHQRKSCGSSSQTLNAGVMRKLSSWHWKWRGRVPLWYDTLLSKHFQKSICKSDV